MQSSPWIAHRPGGDYYLTCIDNVLTATSLSKSSETYQIRTFPALSRDATFGQALFNHDGTLLSICTQLAVYVIRFPETLGTLRQLEDCLDEAQLVQTDHSNGNWNFEWRGGNVFPQPGVRNWRMLGKRTGDQYDGTFTGDITGTFNLLRQRKQETIEEWSGSCSLLDINHSFRFVCKYGQDGTVKASVGRAQFESIDPTYFCKFPARQVCFNRYSFQQLFVLPSSLGDVRIYDLTSTSSIVHSKIDFLPDMGPKVEQIGFVDNLPGDFENQPDLIWLALSCFALRDDGSILVACPVISPNKIMNLRETDLRRLLQICQNELLEAKRKLSSQHVCRMIEEKIKYLEISLGMKDSTEFKMGMTASQTLCRNPLSPDFRYRSNSGIQRMPSAKDFWISRIPSQGRKVMIHRVWSCGRMDVIYWPSGKVEPYWVDSLSSSRKLEIMNNQESVSAKRGPSSNLLGQFQHYLARDTYFKFNDPPSLTEYSDSKIIRCVEIWKGYECLPYIYPTKGHPFAFVCVNASTGECVLFRATWAERLSMEEKVVVLDSLYLDPITKYEFKDSISVFSDPSAGLGLIFRQSSSISVIELMRQLRSLGTNSIMRAQQMAQKRTNQLLLTDSSQQQGANNNSIRELQLAEKAVEQSLSDQFELWQGLQTSLQSFLRLVPPEIKGIVIGEQSKDEGLSLSAANWLNDCYLALTSSSGSSTSIVETLNQANQSLLKGLEQQRMLCDALKKEALSWTSALKQMEDERKMYSNILISENGKESEFEELLRQLRNSAFSCLKRASRLRRRQVPAREREYSLRLHHLRQQAYTLDHKIQNQQQELNSLIRQPLREGTSQLPEDFDDVEDLNLVEETEAKIRCVFNKIDQGFLKVNNIKSLSLVFFIGSRELTSHLRNDWQYAIHSKRVVRIFVHDEILRHARQAEFRRSLKDIRVPYDFSSASFFQDRTIPRKNANFSNNNRLTQKIFMQEGFHELPSVSVIKLILLNEDVTFVKRENVNTMTTEFYFTWEKEESMSQSTEVIPVNVVGGSFDVLGLPLSSKLSSLEQMEVDLLSIHLEQIITNKQELKFAID